MNMGTTKMSGGIQSSFAMKNRLGIKLIYIYEYHDYQNINLHFDIFPAQMKQVENLFTAFPINTSVQTSTGRTQFHVNFKV